jgi:hypothetical protein
MTSSGSSAAVTTAPPQNGTRTLAVTRVLTPSAAALRLSTIRSKMALDDLVARRADEVDFGHDRHAEGPWHVSPPGAIRHASPGDSPAGCPGAAAGFLEPSPRSLVPSMRRTTARARPPSHARARRTRVSRPGGVPGETGHMRVGTRWRAWRESPPPRTHGLSQFERMARQAARAPKTEARVDARVKSQRQSSRVGDRFPDPAPAGLAVIPGRGDVAS